MSESNLPQQQKDVPPVITLIKKDAVQRRFNELLGQKAPAFVSSLLQVIQNSDLLLKADPNSILNAAATAAILNLPINQNLGYAWIVPYKGQGQFQMGWKGYVQLAQRTGQYKAINVTEVYENQFQSFNTLTEELVGDFSIDGEGKVVGYVGYFRLHNGYEKTVYWSRRKVEVHAKKYSQSYKKGFGVWADGEDGFTAMAKKTVLKLMLSQWGVMTIEMQTASIADQAVVDEHGNPIQYPDNSPESLEAQAEKEQAARALEWIEKAEDVEQLEFILNGWPEMTEEVRAVYDVKEKELISKLNSSKSKK